MSKTIKTISTPDLNQNFTLELLGQAVRARRTQSNLRLEDAAALCGVAKQTLMNIELGLGNSQMKTILQVCSGFGIMLRILPWVGESEANDDWQ